MNKLRLVLRSGDPVAIDNARALQRDVTITGTASNPKFNGHPLTVADLQYWLSFVEWGVSDGSSSYARQPAGIHCNLTQEEAIASIQRGFDDFCKQSKVRGERSDYLSTQKTYHHFSTFNR